MASNTQGSGPNSGNTNASKKGNDNNGGNKNLNNSGSGGPSFKKSYRHWRTGKIMNAEDYGYKAWFF